METIFYFSALPRVEQAMKRLVKENRAGVGKGGGVS